jgi:hypothetical protein
VKKAALAKVSGSRLSETLVSLQKTLVTVAVIGLAIWILSQFSRSPVKV